MIRCNVRALILFFVLVSGQVIAYNAGVLPFAFSQKSQKISFLLGQEAGGSPRVKGTWADFGGGGNRNETAIQTGLREFTEETRATYGPYARKKNEYKHLDNFNASSQYAHDRIKGVVEQPNGYTMFLAQVRYLEPQVFKKGPYNDREKSNFEWVDAQDFVKVVRASKDRDNTFYKGKKIRSHFVDMIKLTDFNNTFNNIVQELQQKSAVHVAQVTQQACPVIQQSTNDNLIEKLELLHRKLAQLLQAIIS